MHRSGTSCLAGSLEEAGLSLGQVDRKRHTNPKGNRENTDIVKLNNDVLEANDSSWSTPPEGVCHWQAEQVVWRDRLISEYPTDRLWGFKDPRSLLLLEGWLKGLPKAWLVGTFRHPLPVARSLEARNGFEIKKGVDLWTQCNRRLLKIIKEHGAPLICFDWSALQYDAAMRTLALRLELTPPASGFSFFETNLRTSNDETDVDTPLPAETLDIYRQLTERSRDLIETNGLGHGTSS